MIKVKNKFLGALLVVVLSISSISGVIETQKDIRVVYAAESKALSDAKAKISHLTKSIKTNYLGLKNQGTWQLYISQARELIKKIPNSEKTQKDSLIIEVNKDEALVNALARINQVEKSIAPVEDGGYGNYLGIKNAEVWSEYLRLAKIDLEKIDKSVFKKQYDELFNRMNKVSLIVKDIENEFQAEYDKVTKLYEEAKTSNNVEKAKVALTEAKELGTCDRSDKLEENIEEFIIDLKNSLKNDSEIIKFPDKEFEEIIRMKINKPSGNIYKSDVENIKELSFDYKGVKDISGIENFTKLESFHVYYSEISDITPLKRLTNLKNLSLMYSQINDIRALEDLINLEFIDFFDCEISDIKSLENLTNLEYVGLARNKIRDISPLKNLIKIKDLDLNENQIENVTPLYNLSNMKILFLYKNEVSESDIQELKMYLSNCYITNCYIADEYTDRY